MRIRLHWMAVTLSFLCAAPLAAQQTDAMGKDAMAKDAMAKDAMAMAPHGTFSGAEGHKAKGSYEVVTSNGKSQLKLGKDFSLERGPDVYVVLSPSERVPAQGALYLGRLTRFSGEQSFAVPDGTDLGDYSYVVLWCKKYSVPMGTAALGGGAMMDKMNH
jgi:electron transfer DM13